MIRMHCTLVLTRGRVQRTLSALWKPTYNSEFFHSLIWKVDFRGTFCDETCVCVISWNKRQEFSFTVSDGAEWVMMVTGEVPIVPWVNVELSLPCPVFVRDVGLYSKTLGSFVLTAFPGPWDNWLYHVLMFYNGADMKILVKTQLRKNTIWFLWC